MSIITVWSLLNNSLGNHDIRRGIEIPMIQRDYAQGRNNNKASEIRKVFLNKIFNGIKDTIDNGKAPLELDFIYGFLETGAFIPLDGQQRLTTLYLLHWYFAFKEQKLAEYTTAFSRFNYQTRQSSADFFRRINKELDEGDHADIFLTKKSFETVITNKNWYFLGWKHDLTIQSAITMLDEIHSIFKHSGIEFSQMISDTKPPVIFNFLNIKDFGLTDDLYIKMNARGKPLTNFENLKAELGKFIEESNFNNSYSYTLNNTTSSGAVNVETYFVTRTDTAWSDFFWNIRNKTTNEFDDKLLNILGFVSLNELGRKNARSFENAVKELEESGGQLSYYKFNNLKLLSEASVISYINILDLLVSKEDLIDEYLKDTTYLNKQEIVENSYCQSAKPVYPQRVLFHALFKFLIAHKGSVARKELIRWDRLIRNLVVNTIYNEPVDLHKSLVSIDALIEGYSGDIYQTYLVSDIKGFENQQMIEEKIKIELISKSEAWESFIYEAESHPYLKGQIIFLLSFSGIYDTYLKEGLLWHDGQEKECSESIILYFEKFTQVFTNTGLRHFDDELFRRALLTKGPYLLYSTNWSFLVDNHRDISWKRLLKETGNRSSIEYYIPSSNCLKELFDDIRIDDVEGSLKKVISESTCSDWRSDFIKHPVLMSLAQQKYIKWFDENSIYMLRKSKYNKYADPEVKSFLLKEKLIGKGFSDNDIELGYDDVLQQYGIVRIKNLKPKVMYNSHGSEGYLFIQKGKSSFATSSQKKMIDFLVENFLN